MRNSLDANGWRRNIEREQSAFDCQICWAENVENKINALSYENFAQNGDLDTVVFEKHEFWNISRRFINCDLIRKFFTSHKRLC